jgi:hypothetical protein
MKRAVQRKNKAQPCVTYLTTQEVANILGCNASVVLNRVSKGTLEPAARAGLFARGLLLWEKEQLPDVRRAIIEHSRDCWLERNRRRYGTKV